MRALLDVNVLVALLDIDHAFFKLAHAWWRDNECYGWASCPLTENGVIRIMSNPGYSESVRYQAADVAEQLNALIKRSDHKFWPDDISLLDRKIFDLERVTSFKQLTDAYLLALAVKHDARLVTFDRNIAAAMVKNSGAKNLCVLG